MCLKPTTILIASGCADYHCRLNTLLISSNTVIHTTSLEVIGSILQDISVSLVFIDNQLLSKQKIHHCLNLRDFFAGFIVIFSDLENDAYSEAEILNMGADAFLIIYHTEEVLQAKIASLLRRIDQLIHQANKTDTNVLSVQDLSINCKKHQVYKQGKEINLTYGEFELLLVLVKAAGKLVSRDEIIKNIPGLYNYRESRALDLRVAALRKKLGDQIDPRKYIKTIRGKGYIFIPD